PPSFAPRAPTDRPARSPGRGRAPPGPRFRRASVGAGPPGAAYGRLRARMARSPGPLGLDRVDDVRPSRATRAADGARDEAKESAPDADRKRNRRVGVALRENIGWLSEPAEPASTLDARTKNVLLHLQLRGASFVQDLARVTGLDGPTTQAALWDLFWAGLATPDTFSAVVADVTPARAAGAHRGGRPPRRGLARGGVRPPPGLRPWGA